MDGPSDRTANDNRGSSPQQRTQSDVPPGHWWDVVAQVIMATTGAVAVILIYGTFRQSQWTLKEAAETNKIAAQNMRLDMRAWLSVESVSVESIQTMPLDNSDDVPLHFDGLKIRVKNLGKTPAIYMSVLSAVDFPDMFESPKGDTLIESIRNRGMTQSGVALAPNGEACVDRSHAFDVGVLTETTDVTSKFYNPIITVVVMYTCIGHDTYYITADRYIICSRIRGRQIDGFAIREFWNGITNPEVLHASTPYLC